MRRTIRTHWRSLTAYALFVVGAALLVFADAAQHEASRRDRAERQRQVNELAAEVARLRAEVEAQRP